MLLNSRCPRRGLFCRFLLSSLCCCKPFARQWPRTQHIHPQPSDVWPYLSGGKGMSPYKFLRYYYQGRGWRPQIIRVWVLGYGMQEAGGESMAANWTKGQSCESQQHWGQREFWWQCPLQHRASSIKGTLPVSQSVGPFHSSVHGVLTPFFLCTLGVECKRRRDSGSSRLLVCCVCQGNSK